MDFNSRNTTPVFISIVSTLKSKLAIDFSKIILVLIVVGLVALVAGMVIATMR